MEASTETCWLINVQTVAVRQNITARSDRIINIQTKIRQDSEYANIKSSNGCLLLLRALVLLMSIVSCSASSASQILPTRVSMSCTQNYPRLSQQWQTSGEEPHTNPHESNNKIGLNIKYSIQNGICTKIGFGLLLREARNLHTSLPTWRSKELAKCMQNHGELQHLGSLEGYLCVCIYIYIT